MSVDEHDQLFTRSIYTTNQELSSVFEFHNTLEPAKRFQVRPRANGHSGLQTCG